MPISYRNHDDDDAFLDDMKSLFNKAKSNNKNSEEYINDFFSGSSNDEMLSKEYETIGQMLDTWKKAVRNVKGRVGFIFTTSDDMQLSIENFSLSNDDLLINMKIDKSIEMPFETPVKQIESGLRKFHLGKDAGFKFMFRGNQLTFEFISLIMHDYDNGATFAVSFEKDRFQEKKKAIDSFSTKNDVLVSMQTYFEENLPYGQPYIDKLKILGIIENGNKSQEVFQINHVRNEGNQIVASLEKCNSWRFKEIANDPGAMTVKQFMDRLKSMEASGYLFLKNKGQTYGIDGIDELESMSSLFDEGDHDAIVFKLVPWSEMDESKKTKRVKRGKHMNRRYCESMDLDSKIDMKDARAKIGDAKKEAKKYKTPRDVKKFLDANKDKLDKICKNFDRSHQTKFKAILAKLDSFANSEQLNEKEKETKMKPKTVISGVISFLFWLIYFTSDMVPGWFSLNAAFSFMIYPLIDKFFEMVGMND